MVAKDRVCYYYDEEVGRNYYGPNHPMKPHRLCMTHNLILAYDLHKHLQVFRPRACTNAEFTQFHSEDYVDFLSKITKYSSKILPLNPGDLKIINNIIKNKKIKIRNRSSCFLNCLIGIIKKIKLKIFYVKTKFFL